MERQSGRKLNQQIYSEACEWFTEFRAGDLSGSVREDFDRWLRRSPENLSAYLEIAAIWHEGPSLDAAHEYHSATLIADALKDRGNIIDLHDAPPKDDEPPVARHQAALGASKLVSEQEMPRLPSLTRASPFGLRALFASLSAVAAIVGGVLWLVALRAPAYATEIGEQRSIELDDGSAVALNSRSKVRVRYSKRERDVELLEGQALFNVASDAARPFIVTIGATKVRAVGTEFDVYQKASGTVVTVVEGRVAVVTDPVDGDLKGYPPAVKSPDNTASGYPPSLLFPPSTAGAFGNILVSAGEQLTVTRHAISKSDHPNVAGATAWTQRQLVFDFASLADVAEEFNRYNQRQLIIEDPSLDTFHISGVFSSANSAALIRFLKARPGLQIVETPTEIRIEKKDSQRGNQSTR